MGQVSTIGLDLAKSVFQVHGADASGAVVFRKRLRRSQVRPFLAAQPPARSRWRPAAAPIIGHARLACSGMRSG